jgi:Fe-S cluster assembly iron-binding protein IscA
MFKVSERAAEALHEALDANERDESDVFRLTASLEGVDLQIGEQQDGDQIITHGDRDVLAVQSDAADALDGAVLDAVQTEAGPRLVLQGPDSTMAEEDEAPDRGRGSRRDGSSESI